MKYSLFVIALAAFAQQPQIENAQVEKRTSSGSLAQQLSQLGAGPYWAGYAEPVVPGHSGNMCNSHEIGDAPLRLEGQTAVVVLIRMENARVGRLRVVSPDCRIDAGGLPFYWIENVPPTESIAWLKANVSTASDDAILAIALQPGAAADQALDELTSSTQPDRIREKTAFWLGSARGAHGLEVLKHMLTADASFKVREQVVFAISQSKEPNALPTLIDTARSDKEPQIRGKALFWLAQKASSQLARDTIQQAVINDSERSVKEQAVFALNQLPNGEGIPSLINVAKTHADPAVRKKAMFWLGQSKDLRALDFFAQVLKP